MSTRKSRPVVAPPRPSARPSDGLLATHGVALLKWALPTLLSAVLGYALLFGDSRWVRRAEAKEFMTAEQLHKEFVTREDFRTQLDAFSATLFAKIAESGATISGKQNEILGKIGEQHDALLNLKGNQRLLDELNSRLSFLDGRTTENRERIVRLESAVKLSIRN